MDASLCNSSAAWLNYVARKKDAAKGRNAAGGGGNEAEVMDREFISAAAKKTTMGLYTIYEDGQTTIIGPWAPTTKMFQLRGKFSLVPRLGTDAQAVASILGASPLQ